MADEYEREFRVGKGEVLHRHKATLPSWAFWIAAGLPAGVATVAGLSLAILGLVTVLPALAMVGPICPVPW